MEATHFQPVSGRSPHPSSGWRQGAQLLLEFLPQFLTWRQDSGFLDAVCEIHESAILSRLSLWSQATNGKVLELFTQLPRPNQERLLHAPQFLLLLRSGKTPEPSESEAYSRFIEAEEYLCGCKSLAPAGCWTALGDRYFQSAADPRPEKTVNPLLSGLIPSALYVRTILIDAWSPYLRQSWMMPADSGQMEIYGLDDVLRIEQRVAAALAYLETVNPLLSKTICQAMHVIGAAKASAAPDLVVSMSARRMIGSCALSNLHSSAWRLGDLCDSIIHETIHSLIYRLELILPLYADRTAWLEGRTESPWSGRSLELHSLVHACFVWFGLWNFWAMHSHELPEAVALRDRAAAGFLHLPASSLLSGELRTSLQPAVQSAIIKMFDQVRGCGKH